MEDCPNTTVTFNKRDDTKRRKGFTLLSKSTHASMAGGPRPVFQTNYGALSAAAEPNEGEPHSNDIACPFPWRRSQRQVASRACLTASPERAPVPAGGTEAPPGGGWSSRLSRSYMSSGDGIMWRSFGASETVMCFARHAEDDKCARRNDHWVYTPKTLGIVLKWFEYCHDLNVAFRTGLDKTLSSLRRHWKRSSNR